MFQIGDLIIYSAHGICKIDDICEKTVAGITRQYYVLHPTEDDHQLKISIPVNSDKVIMLELLEENEANIILESFKEPGIAWNDKHNMRINLYTDIVNTGDRTEIAKVINTLMRKKIEAEREEKKLYERDLKLLNATQHILFKELALAFDCSFQEVHEMVVHRLQA